MYISTITTIILYDQIVLLITFILILYPALNENLIKNMAHVSKKVAGLCPTGSVTGFLLYLT